MEISDSIARQKLERDFDVSRETIEALDRYQALLNKWAGQINLVGPSTLSHFWSRHVLDSAQLIPLAGQDVTRIADFGSGAGLPGLVLAALIMETRPNHHITLVEISAKRCGFLREAARTLGVNVTIVQDKIENVTPTPLDFVTARAFAPLEKLLNYAHPWAELGARILFLKGEEVQREIDQASTNWAFQSRINTSVTDSRGCVIEILDLKRR
jgi:16S rRNA (guanine527-N7)-methyltransferase